MDGITGPTAKLLCIGMVNSWWHFSSSILRNFNDIYPGWREASLEK